ncbi:universal stress protein [Actinocorallia sp. A-T 12471]|uniref:universal stress protein n=1 Tax=Actinocorallia sp. A-T 12471 TaxID=3089813 RepID=UPI0029CC66FB|nr:universal stress protein [Actinocorallia sp. A-T 12471]MDX6741666.1 universal stress protein [Actinocorallia sp. A-T 12471]
MKGWESGGIVVGYSGDGAGRAALAWGAAEAGRRGCPLVLCVAWQYPVEGTAGVAEDAVLGAAEAVVREGVRLAGGGRVVTVCEKERPSILLLRVAASADLLVLGASRSAESGMLGAGSVSARVLASATSPVVVVRGAEGGGGVVVGWDGSPSATAAVAWAAQEAALRRAPLRVLQFSERGRGEATADDVGRLLGRQLEQVRDLEVRVLSDEPVAGLIDASRSAGLVVVGARGLGMVRAAALGSVSQALVLAAHCPVAVIRSARDA